MGRGNGSNRGGGGAPADGGGLAPLFRGVKDEASRQSNLLPQEQPKMVASGHDDVEYNMDAIDLHHISVGKIFSSESAQVSARASYAPFEYQVVDRDRKGTYIRERESGEVMLIPSGREFLVPADTHFPTLSESELQIWGDERGLEGRDEIIGAMVEEGIFDEETEGLWRVGNWIYDGEHAKEYRDLDSAGKVIGEKRAKIYKKREMERWQRGPRLSAVQSVADDVREHVLRGTLELEAAQEAIDGVLRELPGEDDASDGYRSLRNALVALRDGLGGDSVTLWRLTEDVLRSEKSCRQSSGIFSLPERGEWAVSGENIEERYKLWGVPGDTLLLGEVGDGEIFFPWSAAHSERSSLYQRRGHRAVAVTGPEKGKECSITRFDGGRVSRVHPEPI